jgi:hypothetical protein
VDDFEEVVELAETLVALESRSGGAGKSRYTFDGSFLISVYAMMPKCRDPVVRRKAIALLEGRPPREDIMDSALSTRIEEAVAVGRYIPEEARIWVIKAMYDMMTRKGRMKYLNMVEGREGEFRQHGVDYAW